MLSLSERKPEPTMNFLGSSTGQVNADRDGNARACQSSVQTADGEANRSLDGQKAIIIYIKL